MMKVVLYSDDVNLIRHWEKGLESDYELVDTQEELLKKTNSLILTNADSDVAIVSGSLKELYQQGNKIFILDRTPVLAKAKSYLKIPVQGYANALMERELLKGAINSIAQGATWIHPELLSELIENFVGVDHDESAHEKKLEPLSEREREVALLIAKGYTYNQMAEKLAITSRTIKAHAQHIYAKLGLKDRFALALYLKN